MADGRNDDLETMRARDDRLDIAVVGTGIAGMAAAWLLAEAHRVTVYEQDERSGGHSNTIAVRGPKGSVPVDMGFIVFNPPAYPNLTALFHHLGVPTSRSDMSLGVSLENGAFEYSGTDLNGLFAQRRNVLRPRFWSMLVDLMRFYREAPRDMRATMDESLSLRDYLAAHGYRHAFVRDHLLPMAAAIWSTPAGKVADQPAAAFIRFCENHGLLMLANRPEWRTVTGGSKAYVARLTKPYADRIRLGCGVRRIVRTPADVRVTGADGSEARYDHVVIAAHADQALAMLADPSDGEARLLGAISYGPNEAILHTDSTLMPRRRAVWSSWNYVGGEGRDRGESLSATYWMNRLQPLGDIPPLFVTLNPHRPPNPESVIHSEHYTHPVFDVAAMRAQRGLWSLQGTRRTWFCGAYFGAGFHEDGLQAGLAVAEALGGVRRPWTVPEESGRIHLSALPAAARVA